MKTSAHSSFPAIENIEISAYKIPTDQPESDGTLQWESTTLVLVETTAADKTGIGYSYADKSAADFIRSILAEKIIEKNCFDIPAAWDAMKTAIRNQGNCGVSFMGLSAVDTSLWDLKAKLLELPLIKLIGMARQDMPVYASGGFTSYSTEELQHQLRSWVDEGHGQVKMKTGRYPDEDPDRVKAAREAIGPDADLFVDANGGYSEKQAIALAQEFADYNVSWFEEPVSSDNLNGLRLIREKVPGGIEVAAGEYGYRLSYFKEMLDAGAVDVLQADATRCGGITGFLRAGTVAEAHHVPFSSHCAPALHLHAAPALRNFRHAEYFHDHVRIERMLFDGVQSPENGAIRPDLTHPGLGLEFRHQDAESYKL